MKSYWLATKKKVKSSEHRENDYDRHAKKKQKVLQQCTGFKDEKYDLEHLATELSGRDTTISILFTPKHHCELAGEGIEYCWGAAKRMYRKLPLNQKKS
jgi:hypothetical protein